MGIHGMTPLGQRQAAQRQIDMRRLGQGVHPGIGASGTLYANFFSGDSGKRFFQVILHCAALGLRLPTCQRSPVVSDQELNPRATRGNDFFFTPGTAQCHD